MATNYRKLIDAGKTTIKIKQREQITLSKDVASLHKRIAVLKKIHSLFKEAAVLSQNFLSNYLQDLVTDAIRAVFPDHNTAFKVEFVTTRDTQCVLSLEEDGKKLTLFDNDGYGALDIISLALHAAYVVLDGSEKILLLDEPFRNLSLDRHELAARMLHGISHQLGIQMIINTHLLHIDEIADNRIHITYDHKNKRSIVKGGLNEIVLDERADRKNVLPNRSKTKGRRAGAKVFMHKKA